MIVVDASVAMKWFLPEPESDFAELILTGSEARTAPEHILVEVGEALLRAWRRGDIALDHAREAMSALPTYVQLTPTHLIAARALDIAVEASCSNYGALYVAASERLGAALVTADLRLYERLQAIGKAENVRLLVPLDDA